MRFPKYIWIAGLATALGVAAFADGQGLGIATPGSPHNFADNLAGGAAFDEWSGANLWNAREEICRVCHVPHDHGRTQHYGDHGLLWNHEVSSQAWGMYSSSTLDGSIASQPTGIAKMCLGCHDGTVAIDTFDKYAGGNVFIGDYDADFQVPGSGYTDFSATHPISVVYDEIADTNLHPKGNAMGSSGTIADVLEGGDTLQCSSCHDVHDQPGESQPGTHLLRVTQKASQGDPSGLCLTCHIK